MVTALATELAKRGVRLDPNSVADRVVLAQLVALSGWNWSDVDGMIANLNVGSIGGVDSDGRGTTADRHAGDLDDDALGTLRRSRLPEGRIRAPYPEREGIYDKALLEILGGRPSVTASGIVKALDRGDEWVSGLKRLAEGRDAEVLRQTIKRRLGELRGTVSR